MLSATTTHPEPFAVLASDDTDYERLGLARNAVAPWEDGARTDNRRGTYEWWYFDAHLDDGSSLVVTFMNKDIVSPNDPLTDDPDRSRPRRRPQLSEADQPRPRELERLERQRRRADRREPLQRRPSRIQDRGDRRRGCDRRHARRAVPGWRPQTYMLFGPKRDKEFAWLPSVPRGDVTATYRLGDEVHHATGVGYHDHNWGNVSLPTIVHDWYWARGQAGPFTVIASLVSAQERYGYAELPLFMLARDREVLADDSRRVRFEALDIYTDELTGKPVATTTRYTYGADGERFVVTFTREHDLAKSRMIEGVNGPKRVLARLARFDGAYLRFAGTLEIERFRGRELVEKHDNHAIWELMYFGHARMS
jgi:hypothetical protein